MITVEYVLALAGTVALWIAIGNVVGPPLDTYRTELNTRVETAQQLIVDLNAMCPAPVSP